MKMLSMHAARSGARPWRRLAPGFRRVSGESTATVASVWGAELDSQGLVGHQGARARSIASVSPTITTRQARRTAASTWAALTATSGPMPDGSPIVTATTGLDTSPVRRIGR